MATYTSGAGRLAKPQPGADSNGLWPAMLDTDMDLIDAMVDGTASIDVTGLTAYTLTSVDGAADQARNMAWNFTGALSADCAVTIPARANMALVRDLTSGGKNVTVVLGLNSMPIPKNSVSLVMTDGSSLSGGPIAATVNPSQNLAASAGFLVLPGGLIWNWDVVNTGGTSFVNWVFPKPFTSAAYNLQCTAVSTLLTSDVGVEGVIHDSTYAIIGSSHKATGTGAPSISVYVQAIGK